MRRRHEERLAISLPVRVWGMDANGKAFSQTATTLDITRIGVRLGGLACALKHSEIVGMQHGTQKARFRVVWAGRPGGPEQGQAGLYCIESGKQIWGESLKCISEAPRIGQRESVPKQYVPFSGPVPSQQALDERRIDARFRCGGTAQALDQATGFSSWGRISDISASGCYVQTSDPIPSGATATVVLSFLGASIRCTAEVRTSHPAVGMGLSFLDMAPEDHQRLYRLLERVPGAPAEQTPRRIPEQHVSPPQPPPPQPTADQRRSVDIHEICPELRRVEGEFHDGNGIDPRILADFRRTLDQAQGTAEMVQKFQETNPQSGSLDELLAAFELKRIQFATELIRELALDVDSHIIQLSTAGLAELVSAVTQLHRRLATMTERGR